MQISRVRLPGEIDQKIAEDAVDVQD